MNEKLYNELNDLDQYDEDITKNKEKHKKKFCWWLFLISVIGAVLAMFLIQIPALIVITIALILTFKNRKKYIIWPQVIVILPNLILLLFFMYTFISGQVTNNV